MGHHIMAAHPLFPPRRVSGCVHWIQMPSLQSRDLKEIHNTQWFYKDSDIIELPVVSLSAEINGMKDEAKVIFSSLASNEFDGLFDLEKFENVSEAPTIFTASGGIDLAVNYLPENYQNVSIPVGFKTGQEGLFQINLESLANLPANVHVYLEDLKEGNTVELNENANYEFVYSPLDDLHRFNLVFKDNYFGIDDPEMNNINIYAFKNIVYINIPEMNNGEVVIYDLMGKEIVRETAIGGSMTEIPVNNGDGYYLVTVQTGGKFISKKVFIK